MHLQYLRTLLTHSSNVNDASARESFCCKLCSQLG